MPRPPLVRLWLPKMPSPIPPANVTIWSGSMTWSVRAAGEGRGPGERESVVAEEDDVAVESDRVRRPCAPPTARSDGRWAVPFCSETSPVPKAALPATSTMPLVMMNGPAKRVVGQAQGAGAGLGEADAGRAAMLAEMFRSVATLVSWVSLTAKVLVIAAARPRRRSAPMSSVPSWMVAAGTRTPLLPWKVLRVMLAPPSVRVPPFRSMSAL